MGTVVSSNTTLVDTAIGPVANTVSIINNYDIDDFVHSTVRAQCITLQIINKALTVNTQLAADRLPVNIGGVAVGGYSSGT